MSKIVFSNSNVFFALKLFFLSLKISRYEKVLARLDEELKKLYILRNSIEIAANLENTDFKLIQLAKVNSLIAKTNEENVKILSFLEENKKKCLAI